MRRLAVVLTSIGAFALLCHWVGPPTRTLARKLAYGMPPSRSSEPLLLRLLDSDGRIGLAGGALVLLGCVFWVYADVRVSISDHAKYAAGWTIIGWSAVVATICMTYGRNMNSLDFIGIRSASVLACAIMAAFGMRFIRQAKERS
jgi:hypothetical protein